MGKLTHHFSETRHNFYENIPDYWADLYGQEYSLFDIREVTEEERRQKHTFAYRCGQIFFKAGALLRSEQVKDEWLEEIGYPKETIAFLRLHTMRNATIIGRFDSVEVNGVEKLLEFNSDTPTFIKELFHVNGKVCEEFGYDNPNEGAELQLQAILQDAITSECRKVNKNEMPYLVFTSHAQHVEDRYTLHYLQELSGIPSKYVPLEQLTIIRGKGLFDGDGEKIDVLYRQTSPIESLVVDEDPDTGEPIGQYLLELVVKNKLRIINPPSAFLLQNKALMAIIWSLHEERSPFFTEEEHTWINLHFLATYFQADPFLENRMKYVKKPVFGREGDTVEIYDEDGELAMQDPHKSYTQYVSIYQQYVDLPKVAFQSEKGVQEGHLMTGTFLLSGRPSAFGFRVGNQITDNLSYYLPCGIR
ncbi:glutathionylspermidine synthase family protein [Priestia koreensis]|uniref:glutathionylspermidine synthase family protein n=1 Tax=Priestia koreensis TaxID=284581 RepID=UPI003D03E35C